MEEKTLKIEKIVVNTEHELTDLVRLIHKSTAERIVLTFTEPSDLLISPINLRVLQETAGKEDKLLIAQIIQNPTGVRNSNLAGIKVVETPTRPTETDWEEALAMRNRALNKVPKKKASEKKETDAPAVAPNSFENRVNSAINRSKEERGNQKPEDILTIDNDIPNTEKKESGELNKKDEPIIKRVEENPTPAIPKIALPNMNIKSFPKPKINIDQKYVKLLPKLLIPFLAILILGAFAYYKFVPFVKVRVFVEAKPVSIEKIFTGDPNVTEVDFDNLKIPVKTEEVTKSLSDSLTATGKAYKGEKATGTVRITYTKQNECTDATPKIILNSGQTISSGDKSYKLTGSAELTCNSMTDVQVQAAEIGEEYNLPASKFFVVPGYPQSEVYGLNSAAFSGGSKTEYTVLSQNDVDTAVDSLSTTAIEEVKSELREKGQGWDIIEDTIKSEVEKSSIKTDVPVGGEASTVNIQLSIKGTATYYQTKDLNEGLTSMLRTEAQDQNLFESNNDWELVLGDNIEKELTVEESTDDTVKIKLVAEANIKPDVDKVAIESKLKGMKWSDGLVYLETLNFAAQPTEVEFNPSSFPDFLKYFPSKRGGILISVLELQSE